MTADNGQREAVYDEFDHLAVTPAGRPLPDPDQPGYRKGGYPDFQALVASPDGRLYLIDAKWIYWMSPDEILHPLIRNGDGLQSGFIGINNLTVDGHGVLYGVTGNQVEVSRITPQGTVKTVRTPLAAAFAIAAGPHGYVYVTGTKRAEHSRIRVYRISPQGQAKLLAPQLPKLTGSIAIDSHGNLYVTSADTIYRLSPREQP